MPERLLRPIWVLQLTNAGLIDAFSATYAAREALHDDPDLMRCLGGYSGDIVLPLLGRDLCLEAKVRADGFHELYGWFDQRDVLIVKADRQEALVVVRLSLAVEIAQATSPKQGPL